MARDFLPAGGLWWEDPWGWGGRAGPMAFDLWKASEVVAPPGTVPLQLLERWPGCGGGRGGGIAKLDAGASDDGCAS